MTLKQLWKTVRDHTVFGLTFWKRSVTNSGIRLSLKAASPRVRFALLTGYEVEDVRLCERFLDRQDRVLELGSAVGFIALFCLKKIGIKDYAMVEANPHLFEVVRENFALNQMPVPQLLHLAAGPVDGDVTFNVSRDYFASTLLAHDPSTEPVAVQQRTIPSILAQLTFTPNVLIMDIEGGETQIPTAHLCLFDKIIVEFHARFVGEAAIERIVSALLSNGYALAATDNWSNVFIRNPAQAAAAPASHQVVHA